MREVANRNGRARRRQGASTLGGALVLSWAIGGCASSSSSGGLMDKTLDLVGLQAKAAVPDVSAADAKSLSKQPRKVALRIHAGALLNTDPQGRSLSLVTKIYRLRDAGPFLQAPYEAFTEAPGAKPRAIEGVIEVREVVLIPGQHYEVVETLSGDAVYVAVVGLFRAPDDRRWRFVFDTEAAAKTGITLGAHGCALSVSEGQPVQTPVEMLRLAGVRCR